MTAKTNSVLPYTFINKAVHGSYPPLKQNCGQPRSSIIARALSLGSADILSALINSSSSTADTKRLLYRADRFAADVLGEYIDDESNANDRLVGFLGFDFLK